nr:MAG TPA: DNA polymerase B [Caudoviricetes sp.]
MALFTADFETTTDPTDCRVWAYGICEIGKPDNFIYGNDIKDFIEWARKEKTATAYFHNLKFDGEFILCWLFENGFKHVLDRKELETNTFTTLISDKGQFYSMEICFKRSGRNKESLTIYDSLKILPFSVAAVAKGFNLPISKLEIDYNETREKGHVLTKEEIDYLRNDVEIMARALNVLFEQGLTKMTQGSNALHDYKSIVGKKNFSKWFPTPEYDADIRQSYKGGFTYLNPKFKEIDVESGIVLDVNSLYPSVMYYQPLPYGEGMFFKGKYKKDKIYNLYVQMLTCQFELKENYIPTIQLKNNLAFIPTQYLTSSDGEDVTLCLTSVDLELFLEHYNVYNVTYHSGWKFKSTVGLFKDYIDKWNAVKMESTLNGNKAMRTLAKLMLNALYGKFALNPNVQSKNPWYDNGVVKYRLGEKETREPIYIPVGTFITAWARYKTISSAQKVYDRFIYADTDSLHLVGTEIPDMLEIDPVKLGAWKHESTFERARFLRQKSYIEEIDGVLNITCAGMPERCYQYVTWDNFHTGMNYAGKLGMTHVNGGIVLKDIPFSIKSA